MDFSIQRVFRRIEGVTFAKQLVGPLAGKFGELEEATKDATGAMIEAYEEQTEGVNELGFTMERAFRAMQVALSEMGDALAPMVFDWAMAIKDMAQAFTGLDDIWKKLIGSLAKDVVVIGLIAGGFAGVARTVKDLLPLLTKLSGVLTKALGFAAGGPLALLAGIATAGVITFRIIQSREEKSIVESVSPEVRDTIDISDDKIADIGAIYRSTLGSALNDMGPGPELNTVNLERGRAFIDLVVQKTGEANTDILKFLANSSKVSDEWQEVFNTLLRIEENERMMSSLGRNYATARTEEMNARKALVEDGLNMQRQFDAFMDNLDAELPNLAGGEEEYWRTALSEATSYYENLKAIQLKLGDNTPDEIREAFQYFSEKVAIITSRLEKYSGVSGSANANMASWLDLVDAYNKQVELINKQESDGFILPEEGAEQRLQAINNLLAQGYKIGMDASDPMFWAYLRMQNAVEGANNLAQLKAELKSAKQAASDAERLDEIKYGTGPLGQFANDLFTAGENYERQKPVIEADINLELTNGADADIDKIKDLQDRLEHLKGMDLMLDLGLDALSAMMSTLTSSVRSLAKAYGETTAASMSAAEGAERMEMAMRSLVTSIIQSIPTLMINAGLQLLSNSADPATIAVGLALIASGLAGEFIVGYQEGVVEAGKADLEEEYGNNAKGGVYGFAAGGAFTNSIVNTPTSFRFANGTGLMGEAGAEAIMPLSRTQDGTLGVVASGGTGNVVINVNNTVSGVEATVSERETSNGKEIDIMVTEKVNAVLASGGADRAMRSRFGVSPRGVR
jgi:hypothetical protein